MEFCCIKCNNFFKLLPPKYFNELFQYATDKTKQDFPLCLDCLYEFIKKEEKEIAEIKELKFVEYQLWKEPPEAPKKIEFEKLKEDFKEFEELEDKYFELYNQTFKKVPKIYSLKDELVKLDSTFLLNESFHIWFDGHFGTINNFRVGRLPVQNVEWNEINSGLGSMVLLLDRISNQLNFEVKNIQLMPYGSFSKIQVNQNQYEFYGGQGYSLFWSSKFNQALYGYFDFLSELISKYSVNVPYEMKNYEIDKVPIKYGNDEKFTKSMKYILTNLKWTLLFIQNTNIL